MRHLLAPLLLLTLLAARADEPRWYEVELVLFEHLADPSAGGEQFPAEAQPAARERLAQLLPLPAAWPPPVVDPLKSFQLPVERSRLQAELKKLDSGTRYRVLRHELWRQPPSDADTQPSLYVAFRDPPLPFPAPAPATPLPTPIESAIADATVAPPARLEGSARLLVGRYLHAELDIVLREPATETQPARAYRLNEKRRVRTGELHYFDHPRFGALLLATPMDPAPVAPRPVAP